MTKNLAKLRSELREAKRTIKALDKHIVKCCMVFAKYGFVSGGATLPSSIEIVCRALRRACKENMRLKNDREAMAYSLGRRR